MGVRDRAEEWLGRPLGRCGKASKLFLKDEAWTDGPAWWFDIQTERVASKECADMDMLCETSDGFHHLRVPTSFFQENSSRMETALNGGQECYRLHLSASDRDRFTDVRVSGGVDFSHYLVCRQG
jgi:hypothetical protein